MGKNGILNRADTSTENAIISNEKEQITIAYNTLKIDVASNTIPSISNINLENELNNNGNKVRVEYIDNDPSNAFLITFINTTHEYIVDQNGNISYEGNNNNIDNTFSNTNNKIITVDTIKFIANTSIADYGFRDYFTDSTDHNSALSGFKTQDGYPLWSPWANGYAFIQSLETYNFDNIEKIEVGYALGTNSSSCVNTFTIGLYDDNISNGKDFNENMYEQVIKSNSYGWLYVGEPIEELTLDTSDITGYHYIKILDDHGPNPSAMTTGARIYWIKIYSIDYEKSEQIANLMKTDNTIKTLINNNELFPLALTVQEYADYILSKPNTFLSTILNNSNALIALSNNSYTRNIIRNSQTWFSALGDICVEWTQPIMTATTKSSYNGTITITSSGETMPSQFPMWRAMDGKYSGDDTGYWFYKPNPGWWQVTFPYRLKISSIDFYNQSSTDSYNRTLTNARLYTDSNMTTPIGNTFSANTNWYHIEIPANNVVTDTIYFYKENGGAGIGEIIIHADRFLF